ncbi:MAG: hypothetical protein AAF602_28385 [Myxococcota bacterium]
MLETAVVIDVDGQVLHWHAPPGATATALPDARGLWEVLWIHRSRLGGVAHVHPGGAPVPSAVDLTTFAACEAGLGRRLVWWIATATDLVAFVHAGPGRLDYHPRPHVVKDVAAWLPELRDRSLRGG